MLLVQRLQYCMERHVELIAVRNTCVNMQCMPVTVLLCLYSYGFLYKEIESCCRILINHSIWLFVWSTHQPG